MIAQAERLDPSLVTLLRLPILDYRNYCQYFYTIEAEVMDRHEHDLEGWADREELCYRMSLSSPWRPVSELNKIPSQKAAAISAFLATDKRLMCMRRQSRREAWRAGQSELDRLPIFEMPAFLDPRDAKTAIVRDDGTIVFEDSVYYPGERKVYNAIMTDRNGYVRRIAPGKSVKFFFNPLGNLQKYIWISDEDGNTVGMCPVLKTASWADPNSIKVAMGQQAANIAETMADSRARAVAKVTSTQFDRAFNHNLISKAIEQKYTDVASIDQLVEMPINQQEMKNESNSSAVDFLSKIASAKSV